VNERGLHQIEELLRTLKNERIDAVYTSDLSRSKVTADAIGNAFALTPIVVPELREIDFGEWEALSWREIELRDPAYARRWSDAFPNLAAPGGESFDAFQSRVLSKVDRLVEASQGCAAVVTHAGVMRVVLRSLCRLDEQEAWDRTREYCGFFRYQAGRVISNRITAEETYSIQGDNT
jgi:broad specificity phosphatase PhoE